MRTALTAAVLAVLAVVAVRVVDGGGEVEDVTPAVSEPADGVGAVPEYVESDGVGLPPDDFEALAAIFDPRLEPLGLRLTRGGLADSPGSGEDPSLRGRHLAVYVEPLTPDHTPDQYVDTLITSAQVFLPGVFERWPGLASMDVCQEPPPGVDDRPAPAPYTVLETGREDLSAVDWATATLADVLDARDAGALRFFADPVIEQTPAFRAAAGTTEG